MTSNDPERPSIHLTMRVEVVGSVELLPAPVVTVTNFRAAPSRARLLVRKDPSESGELRVAGLRTSAPWLVAKGRRIEREEPPIEGIPQPRAGDWIVEVTVESDPPEGSHAQTLSFETGLGREPAVQVPVQVLWRPAIRLSASSLTIEAAPPAVGPGPSLLATFRPDVDLSTVRVESDLEGLEARLEPANAVAYHVRLAWKGGAPPSRPAKVTVAAGANSASAVVQIVAGTGSR